nr:phenylalanine--tRNA ligase subunit alpha [Candidatus Prometheoarchaeum syntrophicum]QEE17845.1 Phenylalanine--tRNA ligase alpha subunit [Candidatus Prometheoarchaeum syntrophicum]
MKISIKTEHFAILQKLQKIRKPIEARSLSEKLKIPYEKLMSGAIFSLEQVGLAKFQEEELELITLTKEAKSYLNLGLPERQIFNMLGKNDRKEVKLLDFAKEIEEKLNFQKRLFFVGISKMKKNRWILSSKSMGYEQIFINKESPEKTEEEQVLDLFKDKISYSLSEIPKKLREAINSIYNRKLVKKNKRILRLVELTPKGKIITKEELQLIDEEINLISSEMLKDGSWKKNLSNLKNYEVNALGPNITAGKYHPLTIIINEVREVFHSMGFEEIKGPIVEEAFYNFDCLFQPQDHPAREMQDTFYLKNPAEGKLPKKKIVEVIKNTHENGGTTGSTGWGYKWSEEIAKKMLLRTHTTATTIRRLSHITKKTKLPMKVFCVDRVFRNESEDRTHLAQFMQIDGIVIGENLTLSDLIGQLVEFYKRMGFDKVVTRPGFFPYTEPSMEVSVYSKKLGAWLEMGGSGMFRPEVTYAWGVKDPVRVLAWGLGLERLAMLKLKRNDIRDLYQSPIKWLREVSY